MPIKEIIMYLIAINIITFLAMLIDKKKAKKGSWRIKESTLLTMGLIGGSIGGIAGMYIFRHKTQKPKFVFLFPTMLVIHIILAIYIIIK